MDAGVPDERRATALVAWQALHGRHGLPWQQPHDPYRVWLSEVMLQQTQVATVLRYFERFVQRFPDVPALAAAPLDDVLALWSGLGYYSRARNLHRCAQQLVQQHQGRLPSHSAALAELPGIGRSTAAAIAAFCHRERAAILDGNVRRVLSRALGFDGDLAQPAQVQALWRLAEALLPPAAQMPAYTQGLMDLGATVCTRRRPNCAACPWRDGLCVAQAQGQPEAYPRQTRRLRRGLRHSALLWLQHGDALWLVQRPDSGIWAGLWSLPDFDDASALQTLTAAWPGSGHWLPAFKHVLTHLDWHLQPLHWRLPEALPTAPALPQLPQGRWFSRAQALAAGLPAPVRKLIEAGAPAQAPLAPQARPWADLSGYPRQ